MDSEAYRRWWESAWQEREQVIQSHFGETFPPGMVVSFSWKDVDLLIPGACAMEFPPNSKGRNEWLTLSHGLSQPDEPAKEKQVKGPSGSGYEYAILTKTQESWCPTALYLLLTYLKQTQNAVEMGHRVPFWFSMAEKGVQVNLGSPDDENAASGEMRAMLFWPYLDFPPQLLTSNGYFQILIGTTITAQEWKLARETSSTHLLLMLFEAGIGQVTDWNRQSLTHDPKWVARWNELRVLPGETVQAMLDQYRLAS